MPRYERFTFLCNENERRLITELATQLQRSQSDAVRFVVIQAAQKYSADKRSAEKFSFVRENKKELTHATG